SSQQLRISSQEEEASVGEPALAPDAPGPVGLPSDGRDGNGSPAGHHLSHRRGAVSRPVPLEGAQEGLERRLLLLQEAAAGGARGAAGGGRGGGAG
ncbi:hypothetical protein M9458_012816, partial [Cirrhinus mrigala]